MNLVREFHETFDHPIAEYKNITDNNQVLLLRNNLIDEEINEYLDAIKNNDIIEQVDALCDISYVCYGALIVYGMQCDISDNNQLCDLTTYMDDLRKVKENEEYEKLVNKLIYTCKYLLNNNYTKYNLIFDECFDEVHYSNMSKSCFNEDDAKKSVDIYKTKNISADYKKKNNYYVIYNRETKKILKNYKFKQPHFYKLSSLYSS